MATPATYSVLIGKRTLELPVVPLASAPISIALFDSLGDLALSDFLAGEMIAQAQDRGIDLGRIDAILTAGKAVTLAESTARKLGIPELSVAEKQPKNYWSDAFGVPLRSITGGRQEQLVVGGRRVKLLEGKRILLIDDVISTGGSIRGLIQIAKHFGEAALVMVPFVEGGSVEGTAVEGIPLVALGSLPVWPK